MNKKYGSAGAAPAAMAVVIIVLLAVFAIGLVAISYNNGGDNDGTDNDVNYDFDNELIQGSLGIGTKFYYAPVDDNGDPIEGAEQYVITLMGQSGSYYLYEVYNPLHFSVGAVYGTFSGALIHKSTGEFFPSAPAGKDSINYNGKDTSLGVWKQTCKAEYGAGEGPSVRSVAPGGSTSFETEIIISSGQDGIPYKITFSSKSTTEYSEYGGSYHSSTSQTLSVILVNDDIVEPEEYTPDEEIGTGYVYNESMFEGVYGDVTYLCVADCPEYYRPGEDAKAYIVFGKINGTLAGIKFTAYDTDTMMEQMIEDILNWYTPDGQEEIDTVCGETLCYLYVDSWYNDVSKAYIGVYDGILYLVEYYYDGELVDSRVLIGII